MLYRLRLRDGPMIHIGMFDDGIASGERFKAPIMTRRRWWQFWRPQSGIEMHSFTFNGPPGMRLRIAPVLPTIHLEIPLHGVWSLNVSLILVDDDEPDAHPSWADGIHPRAIGAER